MNRSAASREKVLALSAVSAALMAVGGLISLPLLVVPFTLQSFFVYLNLLKLGKSSFIATTIYLGMGLVGLPVFAGGLSGYAVILGPAGGFLLAFVGGSLAGGAILSKSPGRRYRRLCALLTCAAVMFAVGWLWLSYWVGLSGALWFGVLPFLPGEGAKIALALAIGKRMGF